MALQSRVGCDNILMSFNNGIGIKTPNYNLMREEIMDLKSKFVVIDTAADTYGGNENARPEVRQYINLLGQLALEIDGTVVLCAHPSRSGLADETGSGGSTAWSNTMRSRLYMRRPKFENGEASEEESKGLRELEKMKSNYSSIGDVINLVWKNGYFHTAGNNYTDKVDQIDRDVKEREQEKIFLDLLEKYTEQGLILAYSSRAANFAPKIMAKDEKGKKIGFKNLERIMDRLVSQGRLEEGECGKDKYRRVRVGLKRRFS